MRYLSLNRLVREPLVHFLLIGAAIFGVYGLTADPGVEENDSRIVIASGEVERLAAMWEQRWQRPPSADELGDLVAERVREEVFYREALALGLDRDDATLRRLLRMKFEFVTQDLAVPGDPDDEQLAAFYEANRERYRTPARFSFTQVFFDSDDRGDGERRARLVLASLRGGAGNMDLSALGDGRLLDNVYRDAPTTEVVALFGGKFAQALSRLEPGVWSGPVSSGYGIHLVRLESRTDGEIPPLDAVRDRLRDDWVFEQRQQANEAIYQKLRARYEVVIEGTDGARPAVGEASQ